MIRVSACCVRVLMAADLVLSGGVACTPTSSTSEGAESHPMGGMVLPHDGAEYREIRASPGSLREVGLCELVSSYDAGAGLYRVNELVGASEPSSPVIYIQLELLDAWSVDAPKAPIVRINGGPSPDGTTLVADIDARQGEEIGALLAPATSENAGFLGLFPLGVFHDLGDGYTNGQLFAVNPVSADELGVMVAAAVAEPDDPNCPDHLPEHAEPADAGVP